MRVAFLRHPARDGGRHRADADVPRRCVVRRYLRDGRLAFLHFTIWTPVTFDLVVAVEKMGVHFVRHHIYQSDRPGFHGRRGFLALWRPLYSSRGAVRVTGSPFSTLADAEAACNTMFGELEHLTAGVVSV